MDRKEYNTCVGKGMSGKKLTKEERNLEFCIVAKTCSGKAKSRNEAMEICSQPKEPKEVRARRSSRAQTCKIDPKKIAACAFKKLPPGIIPTELDLANVFQECI